MKLYYNKQQMSQFKCVLILLFIFPVLSLIVNNCFTSPNTFVYIPYTTISTNTYVNLNFTLSPTFTAAMAIIQTANVAPSLNRQDWIHLDPYSTTAFDYQGMNIGRIQHAFISNPGIGSNLHIYLLSLQDKIQGCYSLKISQSNTPPIRCSSLIFYGSTFYCAACPSGNYGVYCSLTYHIMNLGDTYSVSLNPISYTPIHMKSAINNGISIKCLAPGVSLYFQFEKLQDQMPGLVNYLSSTEGTGNYAFTSGQTYNRSFTSNKSSDILLGLFNNNTFPVTVTVSYLQEETPNTMQILIGILGVLLTIGVIFAIISIIRKIRQARSSINTELMMRQQQVQPNRNLSKKLSIEEIDFYFPTIVRSRLFPNESKVVWKDQKNQDSQFQCIICLCGIQAEDQIKVGYCKHFFHARCLTEWFIKQQSCPYCRKDYSKTSTIILYKQLVKQMEKEVKGQQLVLSLFRPKMNVTMETLQIEDIENTIIQH